VCEQFVDFVAIVNRFRMFINILYNNIIQKVTKRRHIVETEFKLNS